MSTQHGLDADVVVVGAGMAGLYMLHRCRQMGLSAIALETADDVGGTWYWNRYPGARCDIETVDYSYSFDPDLEEEWEWSEKYGTQPEILRYLQHVTERYDLRPHIRFETRVEKATWDDHARTWTIRTDGGDEIVCRWYVMATGCLSAPKEHDIAGVERFGGETYETSRWPHEGVDLTGKRVAVIGTGSSGIQVVPEIADQAASLTVYQRTPNFSVPARNGPVAEEKLAEYEADRVAYREAARWSPLGVPVPVVTDMAIAVSEEERTERYEQGWQSGTLARMYGAFADLMANPESNATMAEFVRGKIQEIVDDPETAEALSPDSYPILTKRLCLDSGYHATFNQDHVDLVDLRSDPIATITETGIDTQSGSREFDAIVFATGFDALTGAIVAVDIEGKAGQSLADRWADGPLTYLGLTTVGFPNLFMITGPQSPSVLSNMAVSIEQHVEWIADAIAHLRDHGHDTMEPTPLAEAGWVQHNNDFGDITLFPQADSWYMGANVPDKPRVFLPYVGGVGRYRQLANEVIDRGYLGFTLRGPDGSTTNDGQVARLKPDIMVLLGMLEAMGAPAFESMTVPDAREFYAANNAMLPPGPEVGEVVDGTLPGPAGDLAYRLYRPATTGPHPIVVYYHGGGWVLGSATSDDPMCRDLCAQSGAIIISVDYRHAPEHLFPAPIDDGWAALRWVADNVTELGGSPGRLAVAGWSAGGNIAAVMAQMARAASGPALQGQVLITPVTDHDFSRRSYDDNAEGYILTTPLMEWFWNCYMSGDTADPGDESKRDDPRASPILADDLSGLPPAVVVTCEFDPLRDEGRAYAEALADAGVPVQQIYGEGQIHTSLGAVGLLVTGAPYRAETAAAIRGLFPAPVSA